MAKKGYVIVEGAKAFCSSAQVFKNKGAAVPIKVASQKKKLGKNKYFAQEKPIATYLDDKAENFNNGQAFVMCQDPKNTSTGYSPCAAKCKIKYKDYYENVEFNKSMKILLDVSTGTCMGYGVPGTIEFATMGQSNNVSQIDVKEADGFSVANASPQWETVDSTTASNTSVSTIAMTSPLVINKLSGIYYYIPPPKANPWSFGINTNFLKANLTLNAQYKGDPSKIIWAIFKEEDTKDKVKTFISLGSTFDQSLDKIFENMEEGKYGLEAYGKKTGDKNCAIIIEVVRDFVKKIKTPGASSLINIPIPLSVEYKLNGIADQSRILNKDLFNPPINAVKWRIKQGSTILYNSYSGASSPHLVSVKAAAAAAAAIFTFKNSGKYTIEAFTDPNDPKPESVELKIENSLGVMGVSGGSGLLRYNDTLKVQVSQYNVSYLPNVGKTANWYLKKEGKGRITVFENSPTSKTATINKGVSDFLFHDAQISDYFGKYTLEAYANPIAAGKKPGFTGGDCYSFEVIKNVIDKFSLPATIIPKGTKVKYNAEARISPLAGKERITPEILPNVTMNGEEKTLTFNELGEYSISAYLTGDYTENKKIETTIKVSDPKIKRALWAYESGVKRTLSGYEEESYGFLEIEGLQNQSLKVKIWVKGDGDDFYKEKDKYLLEEKTLTLNSEGKTSFKIITDKTYREKIEKAIPKTADNPNPAYQLIFTVELQAGTSAEVVLPSNVSIEGTRPVVIDATTTYLEVLDANEDLTITAEKKIVSIMFSTEDGKGIQRAQTFYGKSHKLWVHTVNMQEEKLKIDVFKEVPKEGLNETNHIVYTHESKESYKEEQVGKDGLLEVSFTPKEEWKNPPKNFDYYIAQASRLIVDPADNTKHIWKPEKIQLTTNNTLPADLVRTEDMEKLGIKAHKQDGTAFTQNEMLELRKQFIFYESGCLKVSQLTTPEVIDNDVMPVMVEMAEAKKEKTCWCDRPFSVEAVKKMVEELRKSEADQLRVKGSSQVWGHARAKFPEKSINDFTIFLNASLAEHNINKCIQKIHYLAQAYLETDRFWSPEEYDNSYTSSYDPYRGRGMIHLTLATNYKEYQKDRGYKVFDDPTIVSKNAYITFDTGAWYFGSFKKAEYSTKKYKEKFKEILGLTLNNVALFEDKYFDEISRLINAAQKAIDTRRNFYNKLKEAFKYDKNVCNGITNNVSLGCDGKQEIDLRSKMTFSPQRGATDCNIRCRIIMEPLSVRAENPTGANNTSYYQTAIENSSHTPLVLNQTNFENGVKYIDKSLEAGHPVLVGVNHTLNFGYNEQINTTDHYVIIVGKLCENGEVKYRFWDVGTRKGASEDYKFTLMKDKLFTDKTRKSGHDYTVTQIRRNINNSTGRLITF